MTKYQNVGIVFGGGINGLGVIRNLGRNGIKVYCVVDRIDEAIFSRYCKKRFIIPNIQNDPNILKSFLNKLQSTLREQAVIYSTTDLFSLNLARVKDDIKDNYHVLLPELEIVETLVNKKRFYSSLSDFDVPYPKTYFPDSPESARRTAKMIQYPVYIRPTISQVFAAKYFTKGFMANSPKEVTYYFNLASRDKIDVMLQEIIPGPNKNIFGISGYLDKNISRFFAYNRLRAWPLIFGNTTLMESIPISNVLLLEKIVKDYLEKLKYYGLMEAEFKFDPRDGVFKLFEINARSWWQNSLPSACGLNLVLIAYFHALDKPIRTERYYEIGKKWINVPADMLSLIRSGKLNLREWLSSLRGISSCAFFSVRDSMPWFASFVFNAKAFLKYL